MKKLILLFFVTCLCARSFTQYITQYSSATFGEQVNGQCVLNYGNNLLLVGAEANKIVLTELDKHNGIILRTKSILTDLTSNYPEIVSAFVDSEGKIVMCGYFEKSAGRTTHVFLRYGFENDSLYFAKFLFNTTGVNINDIKNIVSVSENTNGGTYRMLCRSGFTFLINRSGEITRSWFLGPSQQFVFYGEQKDDNNNYVFGAWVKQTFSSRYPVLIKTNSRGDVLFAKTFLKDTAQSMSNFYGSASRLLVTQTALYLAATTSTDNVYGGTDVIIIKCDKQGNVLWTKKYAFSTGDESRQIWTMNELPDGDILASGTASSGTTFLMRLNTNGHIKWGNWYNFPVDDGGIYQFALVRKYVMIDGRNVYITGVHNVGFFPGAVLMNVKINDGILPGCYTPLSIAVTNEKNQVTNVPAAVFTGTTKVTETARVTAGSNLVQSAVTWCSNGTAQTTNTGTMQKNSGILIKVSPVPAKDVLQINLYQTGIKALRVYSLQGRLMAQLNSPGTIIKLPLQEYNPGAYIIKITDSMGLTYSKTFIKE